MIGPMPTIVLIIPSATYRATDFVAAAERAGVELVVASERRPAMSATMGDRSLVIDIDHPRIAADAIVQLGRRRSIDAVIGVDDQGVEAAALASRDLGLNHSAPDAVAATRNKAATRALLEDSGIRQPKWRTLRLDDDAADAARGVGLPCVVKPLSLSASRGVIRADTPEETRRAVARVRRILSDAGRDPSEEILVETYVGGAEVALEGLLDDGRLQVLAIFDKPDPLVGPFFEETIYVTPSRLQTHILDAIRSSTAKAVDALGLSEGPIHAEFRLPEEEPWLLEIAARSIGGLCARALRFGVGVSLEELILKHALGVREDDLHSQDAASGVMMLPIPRAGVLRKIDGRERAESVAGIAGLTITAPIGHQVTPLPEGDRYLGFLFARGETPAAVESSLRKGHETLEVVIE
jgi:biotin carboxylase